MKRMPVVALALSLTPALSQAVPITWELLDPGLAVVGTFELDMGTQTTSNAHINGDLGLYTISSTFTYLNTTTYVGGYPVNNYFKFFSTQAGSVYREDYGGGEYYELRVNDSAMDIGTLGVLKADGSLHDAFIHEIYNFDETYTYCSYYEELYDSEGNYIGDGPCAWYDSYGDYNVESGYWYDGYFLRSATAVPVPATAWLFLSGLIGLAWRGFHQNK